MVSVDSTLCKRNQLEKLNLISKRIESYDAIESNNDEVDKVSTESKTSNRRECFDRSCCPKSNSNLIEL